MGGRSTVYSVRYRAADVLTAALLAVLCLAAALPAFAGGRQGPAVLGIAAVSPVTDPAEVSFQHGVRVAVAVFNSLGGLMGQPIRTVLIPLGSSPLEARHAARQLVHTPPLGIIGPSASTQALAMAEVLDRARIPTITPSASHPLVIRGRPYIFRICNGDTANANAMARFITRHLGLSRVAIITNISSDYSISMSESFVDEAIRQGGEVVWRGQYLDRQQDFSVIIHQLLRLKPECVFLPDFMRSSGLFIQQAAGMGLKTVFAGGDAWDATLPRYAAAAAENAYYMAQWIPEEPAGAAKNHHDRCRGHITPMRAFCKAPWLLARTHALRYLGRDFAGSLEALGYDAACVLLAAARRAGSCDPRAVREALAQTYWHGLTGPLHFDADGAPPPGPVHILQLRNGSARPVQTVTLSPREAQ